MISGNLTLINLLNFGQTGKFTLVKTLLSLKKKKKNSQDIAYGRLDHI